MLCCSHLCAAPFSGYYFLGTITLNNVVYCNVTGTTSVSLGGDGLTMATATTSCANARRFFNQTTSGKYFVALSSSLTAQVRCDMSGTGVTVTTNGLSSAFPAASCAAIKTHFASASGNYFTTSGSGLVYCDMGPTPRMCDKVSV